MSEVADGILIAVGSLSILAMLTVLCIQIFDKKLNTNPCKWLKNLLFLRQPPFDGHNHS